MNFEIVGSEVDERKIIPTFFGVIRKDTLKGKVNTMTKTVLLTLTGAILLALTGCSQESRSIGGTKRAATSVDPDPSTGYTVEQENIVKRLKIDNMAGSIKHLYVISPYSGQVILYSTVQGKVTSGGKRLSPRTGRSGSEAGFTVTGKDGFTMYTNEVLEEDGAFGQSTDYIFWFDQAGAYQQHMMTGGQIIRLSDKPIAVRGVIVNVEGIMPPQGGK